MMMTRVWKATNMTRKTRFKPLGVAQTNILNAGLTASVTRESLPNQGQKRALHSLKRLELIDEEGHTTPSGAEALERGSYLYESDQLARMFEERVQMLMKAWKVRRLDALRRAVAMAVKTLEDNDQ